MERELKINQLYRHFKGDLYLTVDVELDSDTTKPVVIYRNLHDLSLWTRDLEEFLSEVDTDKYPNAIQKYRFEEIELEKHVERKEEE